MQVLYENLEEESQFHRLTIRLLFGKQEQEQDQWKYHDKKYIRESSSEFCQGTGWIVEKTWTLG